MATTGTKSSKANERVPSKACLGSSRHSSGFYPRMYSRYLRLLCTAKSRHRLAAHCAIFFSGLEGRRVVLSVKFVIRASPSCQISALGFISSLFIVPLFRRRRLFFGQIYTGSFHSAGSQTSPCSKRSLYLLCNICIFEYRFFLAPPRANRLSQRFASGHSTKMRARCALLVDHELRVVILALATLFRYFYSCFVSIPANRCRLTVTVSTADSMDESRPDRKNANFGPRRRVSPPLPGCRPKFSESRRFIRSSSVVSEPVAIGGFDGSGLFFPPRFTFECASCLSLLRRTIRRWPEPPPPLPPQHSSL